MFISRCVDFVRVGSESGVLHIMLKFFTITLTLDAQRVSLVSSKDVTIMQHYAYAKKTMFSLNPHFTEAWARATLPLFWIDVFK